MKAMVLAAGLGTRLRPVTDNRPKALVEVAGRTMLEIVLARLRGFGVREAIVNVHHFADEVVAYLEAHGNFGMRIEISREPVLLDTGGGLKKAAPFFLDGSASAGEPFLLHNVDVLSTIDFAAMLRAHIERDALATLAVQERVTTRPLFFDENNLLCGRGAGQGGKPEIVRFTTEKRAAAFCGIHVLSPRIFGLLEEDGIFSIIPAYLRLARHGETVAAFDADAYRWRDLGRPESVAQAAQEMAADFYSES